MKSFELTKDLKIKRIERQGSQFRNKIKINKYLCEYIQARISKKNETKVLII